MKTKFFALVAMAVMFCMPVVNAAGAATEEIAVSSSSVPPCGRHMIPLGYYIYETQGRIELVLLGSYPSSEYLMPVYAEVFLNGKKVGGDISPIVPGYGGYCCDISYQHDFSNTTNNYYVKVSGGCSCADAHYSYAYFPAAGNSTGTMVEYY